MKSQRNKTTVQWSKQVQPVKGETDLIGHSMDATPFNNYLLILSEELWDPKAEQTNLYAKQKQEEKQQCSVLFIMYVKMTTKAELNPKQQQILSNLLLFFFFLISTLMERLSS